MSGHITKLTYLRNGGLRVFVDGQALCVIDAADWGAFGLSRGDALSGESGEALQQCAQRFEARKRAAASLVCQAYSAKGLERRLRQKGTPAQAAQEAVEHYRSLGYLEDGVFAQNLAQRLHETKNYAKRRIAQELRAKGVEQQTVQEVLETLPPDEAALRRSLEKKYRTVDWSDAVQRRRAVRALLRDGFAWEQIAAVVGHVQEEEWE